MNREDRRIVFVCEHGAFRSRIAAAYFNASVPRDWSAVSAGVTPQTEVSTRVGPLMAGTAAAAFVDAKSPRPLSEVSGERTIAIDTDVAGAETWHVAGGTPGSDAEVRDEIRSRVMSLVRDLSGDSEAG